MSANRLAKLADKFDNKYRLLSKGQAQVGPDNESKFKYAMNALARIVAFLQHPEYKKLLGDAQVAADNTISAYKFVSDKMKKWYNVGTQKYNVPEESVLDGQNIFEHMMPDVEKAVVQIKNFIPADQQPKLQFYLDSLKENVRQIEVFNP